LISTHRTRVGIHNTTAIGHRITGRGRSADNMKHHPTKPSRSGSSGRTASRGHRGSSRFVLRARVPRAAALTLLASPTVHGHAADADAFESLWSRATLYKNESNPVLQEFKLRGRYQGQYWDVDADNGSRSDWEDRRSRLGFDAKLFEKTLEIRADFQSNDGFNDLYDGLVDAYLRWKPVPNIAITLGKTKPLIGHYDWLESSNDQPTFERSQIFNQLRVARATALTAEGTCDAFTWRAGVYSNDTPLTTADANGVPTGSFGDGEFGDFNGGWSFSLGIGYDFKEQLGLDKADLRLDWLHSDRDAAEDLVLNRYDDILSGTFWIEEGDFGLVCEVFHASGGDGGYSNVLGFHVQPTYNVIPNKLQLVGRYSFAHSVGELGVSGQSRYERTVASNNGLGDIYHAIYGGAQYFIHGDKLKLMAGAEYAWIHGNPADAYDGLTVLTGIRLSF
jgi:phosphate-selective porin OprO and OprP